MNEEMKEKLQRMVLYKQQYCDTFKWDNGSMKYVAALLCAVLDREITEEKLERMRQMIIDGTKHFSAFRKSFQPLLSLLLAMQERPEELFSDIKEIYSLLRNEKFTDGSYTVATAYYIAAYGEPSRYQEIVQSFKTLYKRVKKLHPLLTGVDDYLNFAMMAIKRYEIDATVERLEHISDKLQAYFGKGNELQAVASAIVLLNGDDDAICRKVIQLDQELKHRGYVIKGYGTSATLVILAELGENEADIADQLVALIQYIETLEGYDAESIDYAFRYMIAVVFLAARILKGEERLQDLEENIVVTQTLCFMVLIGSCSSTTLFL